MNRVKDHKIQACLQENKYIPVSEEFTNRVMRELPPRSVLPVWSFIFLVILWIGVGVWFSLWYRDLIESIREIAQSIVSRHFPHWISIFSYSCFISMLAITFWQTSDFFLKLTRKHKVLKY